jgi:hypothetical protein
MPKLPRLLLLILLILIAIAPLFAASNSATAFKKTQLLARNWDGKDNKGQPVKTNFKSIVSGTAVMETLAPTGMEDMVTVYSLDGDGIALIHFCPNNNQPRMRVIPATSDPTELAFRLRERRQFTLIRDRPPASSFDLVRRCRSHYGNLDLAAGQHGYAHGFPPGAQEKLKSFCFHLYACPHPLL